MRVRQAGKEKDRQSKIERHNCEVARSRVRQARNKRGGKRVRQGVKYRGILRVRQ